MPYGTESKSRNADFISIAREGNPPPSAPQALSPPPERSEHNLPPTGGHNPQGEAPSTLTPKACPMVRSKNDTSRRLAVRIAMGCQIGALPCTPFASSRRSPQGETRSMERKNRESYISCTIPQFPPLVVNAVSQSPACVSCHMIQQGHPVTLTL